MNWRVSALVAAFIATCCAPTQRPAFQHPTPVAGVSLTPHPGYERLYHEAAACAAWVKKLDSLNTFLLRDNPPPVDSIQWFAVPTERPDGTFPCSAAPAGWCWGETAYGDSARPIIRLSVRWLTAGWLVKHEMLHVLAISPREAEVPEHGLPWSLCQWL